jgi:hypothetical protein
MWLSLSGSDSGSSSLVKNEMDRLSSCVVVAAVRK